MRNLKEENQIPCIVEYGTIFSKRDMIRILRDLDKVRYVDMINNVIVSQGEGFVIEVMANSFDSTLIFNSRLHINVNGFEALKVRSVPEKEIDLISGYRVIKLKPVNRPSANDSRLEEEIDEQRIATISQLACDNEYDINYFAD